MKYLRQVITAAADGAIAAVAAEKYLAEEEGFKERVLHVEEPVMVIFWAPQIEASIAAVSLLEQAACTLDGSARLVKMDTYRNQRVAKRYGVEAIPSLLFFHHGEVAGRLDAGFTLADVEEKIKSLR